MSTERVRADASPRPIIVGYDGSPAAARALERAATLAGTDGRVVVVTARPSAVASGLTQEPILDALCQSSEKSARGQSGAAAAALHQRHAARDGV